MVVKARKAKRKGGRKGTATGDRPAAASLSEWVYAELRKKVVSGDLRPGDRLREVELAGSLCVSRTPVREALKRLESDGLLNYLPSRGAVISSLTPEQAGELYELRKILEGAAARLAAQHALDHEIQLLKDLLRQQKEIGEGAVALARLNRNFHSALYRMSHNRYLIDVLTRAQVYMVLLRDTTYRVPGRARTAYAEHSAIVDAIARHDADGAETAARHHLGEAQRTRMMLEFGDQMRASAGRSEVVRPSPTGAFSRLSR